MNDAALKIRSQFPTFFVEVEDESKFLKLVEHISNLENQAFFSWSTAQGLRREGKMHSVPQTQKLFDALRYVSKSLENGMYVLFGAQPFLNNPLVRHLMREIAGRYQETAKILIFVNADIEMPPELLHLSGSFELPSDDVEGMQAILSAQRHHLLLAEEKVLQNRQR